MISVLTWNLSFLHQSIKTTIQTHYEQSHYWLFSSKNWKNLIRMFSVKIFNTLRTTIELGEVICSQGPNFILPRSVSKRQRTKYKIKYASHLPYTESDSLLNQLVANTFHWSSISSQCFSQAILSLTLQLSLLCYKDTSMSSFCII